MAPEKSMEELVQAAIRRQEQASTTTTTSSTDNVQGAPTDAELDRVLEKCTKTEPRQNYEDIILALDEEPKSEEDETPADAA